MRVWRYSRWGEVQVHPAHARVLASIDHHDGRTLRGEALRRREPKAAGRASDDGYLRGYNGRVSVNEAARISHSELESRFRQAIQPTSIDSAATTSGATPCPYSPWSVTVASAANITVQPSAEPHSRVCARTSKTAVVSSSDPVTKWNQRGYPHRRYSS
jgi:hypothetical protein